VGRPADLKMAADSLQYPGNPSEETFK